jgi:hypothetical protein
VVESGEDWIPMGRVWLSDGLESGGATLFYRVAFEESPSTALLEREAIGESK